MSGAPKERKQRDRSPVAESSIWSEAVKKEKSHQKVYEHFSINPRRLFPQPDKPNNNIMLQKQWKPDVNNPFFDSHADLQGQTQKSADLEQDILSKLSSITLGPRSKYPFPATSNQDIGWHNHESRSLSPRKKNNKFDYKRVKCNETTYANDYFNMLHISPFSNKFK